MPMPMAQTARTMKIVAPTQCPAALEKATVIMMLIVQGLLSVVSTTVCGAWIQEALRMIAVKNQVCGALPFCNIAELRQLLKNATQKLT